MNLKSISEFFKSTRGFIKEASKTRRALTIASIIICAGVLVAMFSDKTGWMALVAFIFFLIAVVFLNFISEKKSEIVVVPENPDSKERRKLYEKRGNFYVPVKGAINED